MNKKLILTKIFTILSICLLLISCNNSPRRIISDGSEWIISDTDKPVEVEKVSGIIFNDSTITVLNENTKFNIKWIDGSTYSQVFNGTMMNIALRVLSKDVLQVAFLSDSEAVPQTDADWATLVNGNKVKYFVKPLLQKTKIEDTKTLLKAGDKELPAGIAPVFGLYKYKCTLDEGWQKIAEDDWSHFINVQIMNGTVSFQTGDSPISLKENPVEDVTNDGEFYLKESFCNHFGFQGTDTIVAQTGGTYTNYLIYVSVKNSQGDGVESLLSSAIGSFNNGILKVKYSDYKDLVDKQYSQFSSKFENLIFKIDSKYLLTTEKYSYPFDMRVVFFKIYPDNEELLNWADGSLTSVGGVVFEKKYGTWLLLRKNFMIAPTNPESGYRSFGERNPEINRSKGTIQFNYFESYILKMGQTNRSERSYFVTPYLDKTTAIRRRGNFYGLSDPEYEEW